MGEIIIMPCLSSLEIDMCPKLKTLPDHHLQKTALQELKIGSCPILKERYGQETGVDWPKIREIWTRYISVHYSINIPRLWIVAGYYDTMWQVPGQVSKLISADAVCQACSLHYCKSARSWWGQSCEKYRPTNYLCCFRSRIDYCLLKALTCLQIHTPRIDLNSYDRCLSRLLWIG